MTGDTLWRKWQEIRNKLRNSIISSSNIAQDLHKLPSGQGLKDAYFKFVCNIYKQSFQKKNPMCQIMIDGVDLPGQSTSRLEIMVVPSPPNHWEYRDPTLCYLLTLKIFRKNMQLVPDVKDSDVVNISRQEMLLADREEKRNKEHGRSNKRKHHHDEYSSPSKQKTPTMMDMSMLNFQAAQTRKGKTDEIVAHLDLYERFKHILPEDRYHAAVLNCFDNLPFLQTYDVESTSVLTDKSVVSATSVFGNELTPTNTTPIPSFVRMMSKIKIKAQDLLEAFALTAKS